MTTPLPTQRRVPRWTPLALVCIAALLLAASCNDKDKAAPANNAASAKKEAYNPPSEQAVEAAVKEGQGEACEADADCAMYLRCFSSVCTTPPAMDGEPVGEGPTPALAIVADKGEVQFFLEVVEDAAQRSRGLMYRPRMDDGWGMLFIYPEEDQLTFWMKNTYIPLDMVFIGADKKVVGVVAEATPHTLDSRKVDGESQYVLELNAGIAERYGIKAGNQVHFANLP